MNGHRLRVEVAVCNCSRRAKDIFVISAKPGVLIRAQQQLLLGRLLGICRMKGKTSCRRLIVMRRCCDSAVVDALRFLRALMERSTERRTPCRSPSRASVIVG